MEKITLVVSAVNFTTGGPLSIARNFFKAVAANPNLRVIAFVYNKDLYEKYSNIKYIAIPKPKKNWINRIIFEYLSSYFISRRVKHQAWLSLHDVTPNVISKHRFVYCHNPSPFYRRAGLRELIIEPSFFVFRYLYSFFYRFNIRKNDAIFVQQQWLAKAFKERYGVNNVVVSYPTDLCSFDNHVDVRVKEFADDKIIRVIYPAVPRVFKNYECLFQAAELVEENDGFSFNVTIDGSENKYSKELYRKYSHLRNINFLGYQSAEMMKQAYQNSDVLCFPSMLETWGLPISEAKDYSLRIFAADLPYAHETVGKYPYASFFSPESPKELANLLLDLRNKKNDFSFSNMCNNSDDNHGDSWEIFGWDNFLKFIIYKVKND